MSYFQMCFALPMVLPTAHVFRRCDIFCIFNAVILSYIRDLNGDRNFAVNEFEYLQCIT